jgi:hypothetical protein
VVGEGRCEHRHVASAEVQVSVATGPRGAHSWRVDLLVDEVVHATGVGVGRDDDECSSVSGVSAGDVVVASRAGRPCAISASWAASRLSLVLHPVLRPHGCKWRGSDDASARLYPFVDHPHNA